MIKKKPFTFTLISVISLGIITPFIDYFVVIQMFFLLIPFGIILMVFLILFIINLIIHKKEVFKVRLIRILIFLPIFLIMQITSVFMVDKIQRLRSEQIITKLKNNKNFRPDSISTMFGIKYKVVKYPNNFEIEYERGFFVREVYYSEDKSWQSHGWND